MYNYLYLSGRSVRAAWLYTTETWLRILVQVTIYRRPRIDQNVHLVQSEAYDIS